MAKRVRISAERCKDMAFDIVLYKKLENGRYYMDPQDSFTMVHADLREDRSRDIVSASVPSLIDRGYVTSVYINFLAGERGPDAITYIYTNDENHPWIKDGTLTEEF